MRVAVKLQHSYQHDSYGHGLEKALKDQRVELRSSFIAQFSVERKQFR